MASNQSTYCDDDSLLPGQEIPRVVRKTKTDYFLNMIPPLDPIPSQINPIQSITIYTSNIDYYYGHFAYA
jgi:hypothetical protein